MAQRSILFPLRAFSAATTRTTVPQSLTLGGIRFSSSSTSSNNTNPNNNSFLQERPSPPRLPREQQAEFERLQRTAEAALHSHTQIPASSAPASVDPPPAAAVAEGNDGMATLSGGIRKGAPPEFEGEQNPKTGEIGGPKNEPLRWGAQGDYSFNGRVTDF